MSAVRSLLAGEAVQAPAPLGASLLASVPHSLDLGRLTGMRAGASMSMKECEPFVDPPFVTFDVEPPRVRIAPCHASPSFLCVSWRWKRCSTCSVSFQPWPCAEPACLAVSKASVTSARTTHLDETDATSGDDRDEAAADAYEARLDALA